MFKKSTSASDVGLLSI